MFLTIFDWLLTWRGSVYASAEKKSVWRSAKRSPGATTWNVNLRVYVFKYFNDISVRFMHSVRLKSYDLVLLIKTFSFNYFKVRLFLSFCFFLVEGCLLPWFKNETSVTLKHPYYKFYCLIPLKMVVLTRKQ